MHVKPKKKTDAKNLTHEFEDIQVVFLGRKITECIIDGVSGVNCSTGNRVVFRFGDKFVVKFDGPKSRWIPSNVTAQNDQEIKNYKFLDEEDKKFFPKLLRVGKVSGRKFLVQEFVKNTRAARASDRAILRHLKDKYGLTDFALDDFSKYHHNVACYKNEIKLFDIGYEDFSGREVSNQQGLF